MTFPADRLEVEADAALAMDSGFDVIATGDHLRHPRDPSIPLLDGWSVAAAWGMCTTRLRIAMLVNNLIYRHPVLVAKSAIAVDQLSGGRFDLGVGAGVYPTDHSMAGVDPWAAADRVSRFDDFLHAMRAALRGDTSFDGRVYRFVDAAWSPGPLQVPGPPLVVGGAGRRVLRLVAEHADVWSAFGGYTPTDHASFFAVVADQAATLERACLQVGRDPASLRRSLLAFRPLAPWQSIHALTSVVLDAHRLGFDEVILYKPADTDERRVFDTAQATLTELKHL